MNETVKQPMRIAILDLYDGVANQGMRCIREILNQYSDYTNIDISWDEFDVRQKNEVPDLSYDIFISSGGPGSPLESIGTEWENVSNSPADTTRLVIFVKEKAPHSAYSPFIY